MSSISDILFWASEKLRGYGADCTPADLKADEQFHRLKHAGATRNAESIIYILHCEENREKFACLVSKNYRGDDDFHTDFYISQRELFRTEREKRRAYVEQRKREYREEERRRAQSTLEYAQQMLNRARPATPDHPYALRKQMSVAGLFELDGELLVPVTDIESGSLHTLQRILPKKNDRGIDKLFLAGPGARGHIFRIPKSPDCQIDTVLVVEGVATGSSAHQSTGAEVWCCLSAHNIKTVCQKMKSLYPDRKFLAISDNDSYDEQHHLREPKKQTGNNVAADIKRLGMASSVCPLLDDNNADLNDWHVSRGLASVQKIILDAIRETQQTVKLPNGYYVVPDGPDAGLYHIVVDKTGRELDPIRLGAPLEFKGMTVDDYGSDVGVMVQFRSVFGETQTVILPWEAASEQGDRMTIRALTSVGWQYSNVSYSNHIKNLLLNIKIDRTVRLHNKPGWHGDTYCLPARTFSKNSDEQAIFKNRLDLSRELYTTAGTFDGWKRAAGLCVGNPYWEFCLVFPFAGPLLDLARTVEGGAVLLVGASTVGKTTGARIAASVMGNPKTHVHGCRATDNALENVFLLANDSTVLLDELSETKPRTMAAVAYMLANGHRKLRANRNGDLRNPESWQCMGMMTGEVNQSQFLQSAGLPVNAGALVRVNDINIPQGHIVNLHGMTTSAELANRLNEIVSENYGHAFQRYIEWIVDHYDETVRDIPEFLTEVTQSLCPSGASGQARRVAQRFALIMLGGNLARQADILPAGVDVDGCVKTVFDNWLSGRGGAGDLEERSIIEHVLAILEKHGSSRFQRDEDEKILNRLGYFDDGRYLVLPEQFKQEFTNGRNLNQVINTLETAGILHRGESGEIKPSRWISQEKRTRRVYILSFPNEQTGGK